MSFKVKEHPKKVYEAVTYDFTLINNEGEEFQLRKWEDSNGGGFYIFKDDNWVEFFPDEDLEDFITYDLDF